MPEALGVIDAPSGIETSAPSPTPQIGKGKPSAPQKSSLGGGANILKGFQEIAGKFGEKGSPDKSAIPSEKAITAKPAKKDGEQTAVVEKTEAEKATEAEKLQSTEAKGTDGMTPTERAEFVKEKKAAEGWKAEKEKVTAEINTLKEQLEQLRVEKENHEKRAKELEPVALIQDIRLHPKYDETIGQPKAKIEGFLTKVCKKFDLKESQVHAAIWNEDEFAGNEAIAEMKSNMDDVTSTNFATAIQQLRQLDAAETKLMSDPVAAMTALNAEKKKADAEAKAQAEKTYNLSKEAVWEAMPEKFPFLKEIFKNEDAAKEIKADADAVNWEDLSPDGRAFYAQAGSVFLRIPSVLKTYKDEIAQLKKALETATGQTTTGQPRKLDEGDGGDKRPMKPSEFLKTTRLFGGTR